jgi:hypothetical protein
MKFKLTKALIFACIIMSEHSGFAQRDFDRDFGRDSKRSGSTEEVTNMVDIQKKNNLNQLGTNFQILSNIGANLEYSNYMAISKPNENGYQALYLGSTYGVGYGSKEYDSGYGYILKGDLVSFNLDMTLDYKFPIQNNDNLTILAGAGLGYYSILVFDDKLGTTAGKAAFVVRSSVSYFFSPTIGIFGNVAKAGSRDISFSAGLVFRKAR